jgi:phenylalanyl-tRNA synthetase beta chain
MIKNPLSNELNVMRQTLLFGGLETIQYNANRQHPDLKLFECGNCYFYHRERESRYPLDKYHEEYHIALLITGKRCEPNWASAEEFTSFYQLKAYLESILSKMGFKTDSLMTDPMPGKHDLFMGGLVYSMNNVLLAEIAIVNQTLLQDFDLRNEVFYAWIHWDNLIKIRGDHKIKHRELPKFPEVRRDLSLLLDKTVTFAQIRDIAFRTEREILTRINLFDVYEGEQIGKNKKSYAVSFILQDIEATLTDERIDRIMKKLMDNYQRELGAEIR